MTTKTKVLIPVGFGLNCEEETAYSFRLAGVKAGDIHLKNIMDIVKDTKMLSNYHILAFVGGFSFGDHVAAGKILANIYRLDLGEKLKEFIGDGKLIFGECNGFQTMVKTGMLPGIDGDYETRCATLMNNDSGTFEDRWVHLRVNEDSNCVFTKGLKRLYLPIRHGEGKFVVKEEGILRKLRDGGQIVLQYADGATGRPTMAYPDNPNGSADSVAGICDRTGRVFGLMPHPTAYLSPYNHPNWTRLKVSGTLPKEGEGVQIFRNAVKYVEDNF